MRLEILQITMREPNNIYIQPTPPTYHYQLCHISQKGHYYPKCVKDIEYIIEIEDSKGADYSKCVNHIENGIEIKYSKRSFYPLLILSIY